MPLRPNSKGSLCCTTIGRLQEGLRPRHQELHTVEVGQDLDVEVSAGIDVAVDARHPLVVALPLPGDPQARADANEGDEWTGDDGHKRDIGHKDIIPRA